MKKYNANIARDLFLCTTPLQMVIASKIIESPEYKGEKPDLVLAALSKSDRYDYYYKNFSNNYRLTIKLTGVKFPFYLYYIVRYFMFHRYRRVYLASIDSSFFQLLASYISFDKIITFDDGTANISKDSIYYRDQSDFFSKAKRIIFGLAGNRYSRKKFIEESLVHYTIYPDFENISDKLKYVDLIGNIDAEVDGNPEVVTIILGSCYKQIVKIDDLEGKLINEFVSYVKNIKSDQVYYIPHPRDERDLLPGIERINDHKISEEIITDLIKSGRQVILIGFASSVQFTFLRKERVENIAIKSNLVKDIFNELADNLSRHGGKVSKI